MGILSTIGRAIGFKASATAGSIVGMVGAGQPVYTPDNYEALAKEGYKKSVYAFRAINIVAQACAGVPIILLRDRGGRGAKAAAEAKGVLRAQAIKRLHGRKEVQEVDSHPLLTLLRNPNPGQGGAQLVENLVAYRMLSGNGYLEGVGPDDVRKPPKELYALRPDRTRVVAGDTINLVARFEYEAGGQATKIARERMLHWKTFNPLDDWYGLPPLVAASRSVDQNNSAKDHNVALFQNGARPSGALEFEGALQDNAKKNLLTQIREAWRGARNAGKILLLEKGMKWQQIAISPVDLDYIEGTKLSATEIVMAFGVPMILVNPEGATFANMSEARRHLYQETVLPLLDNLIDELNRWLVPLFGGGLLLALNTDGIEALREEQNSLYTRATQAHTSNILTVNEARSMLGWDEDAEFGGLYKWQIDFMLRFGDLPGKAQVEGKARQSKSRTPEQRAAEWKAAEASRRPFYTAMRKQLVKLFTDEQTAVLAALEGVTEKDLEAKVDSVVDGQVEAWTKLLTATYMAVGEAFAKDVLAKFKDEKGHRPGFRKDEDDEENEAQGIISRFIRREISGRVQLILKTTREALKGKVGEALSTEGASTAETISDLYAMWLESRTTDIATTEVVTAAGVGGDAGAMATGLALVKAWISTRDDAVREAHDAADGQEVPMDEPFEVGGDQLMYPGDTSLGAGPGNVINCRCFVKYDLKT